MTVNAGSKSVFTCSLPDSWQPETLGSRIRETLCRSNVWGMISCLPLTELDLSHLIGGHQLAIGWTDDSLNPTTDVYTYDSHTNSWHFISCVFYAPTITPRDAEKGRATTTQQKGKATQHNLPEKTGHFSKKNWLPQVGLERTTISSPGRGYTCYCCMPGPSFPVLLHILPSSSILLHIYCTFFSTFRHCHPYILEHFN